MPKTVEEKAAVAAAEAAGNLNVSIVLPPADTWDKKLNVYQRLLKVVAEVNHVDKSGRNEFHKYDYVKAADLAHPIRNALTENGVFAEFEREMIRERVKAGLERTRANGTRIGRPESDKADYVRTLVDRGLSTRQIRAMTGVGFSMIHRILGETRCTS